MFRRAFRDWTRHGILVSKAALDEFFEHRDLLPLDQEHCNMIIESAYASGKYGAWRNSFQPETVRKAEMTILEHSSSDLARRAALSTRSSRNHQPLGLLARFAFDDDRDTRGGAISGIAEQKSHEAVELLLDLLEQSDSSGGGWGDPARLIAGALGDTGNAAAVGPLIELLTRSPQLSYVVTEALTRIGSHRAVAPLIAMLSDEEVDTGHIAGTLAALGNMRAFDPLARALKSSSGATATAVAGALTKLDAKNAVELLIDLLQSADSSDVGSIVSLLGDVGDQRAVDPLIYLLENGDTDNIGRIAHSLREIGDQKAVEPLIKVLDRTDRYDVDSVATALGEFSDGRALKPLILVRSRLPRNRRGTIDRVIKDLGGA